MRFLLSLDEGTRGALYDEQGLRRALELEPLVCRYRRGGRWSAGKVKSDGVPASGITNQRDDDWIELFLPCGRRDESSSFLLLQEVGDVAGSGRQDASPYVKRGRCAILPLRHTFDSTSATAGAPVTLAARVSKSALRKSFQPVPLGNARPIA